MYGLETINAVDIFTTLLELGTMDILKDSIVTEYISSLEGLSPAQNEVSSLCQCISGNIPKDIHSVIAVPYSSNLVELAANTGVLNNVKLILMYISNTSYFNGDSMKFLVNKMLESKLVETVEHYYNALDKNLKMHPPCAQYMDTEYEKLLLSSNNNHFGGKTLWDYLIESLTNMTEGSLSHGVNKVVDLAFKRCFSLCIRILQFDFEVSKKKNIRSLVAKCLKYKLERRTRMSEISKLLDRLFNTGYDFQMLVIDLALLVRQLQ